MAEKLWQKNYTLDSLMEAFTVKRDYILDEQLLLSDLIGSAAQAKGLERIGILSKEETDAILEKLEEIAELRKKDSFVITRSMEDCHTAIELYLTEKLGETGKKIHTGRSRNDQVLTALRLYMREATLKLEESALNFAESLIKMAEKNRYTPMPGRTHMQIAMPSSVALWALSFAEEILDTAEFSHALYALLNQSPLGSAASYGTTLNTDRKYLSSLMGFEKVQNNVLYSNNSRGRFEAMFLDLATYYALTISKLAQDLILFTLPEFSYFSLPKELTTGSSIMPQKKNPDGLELARSRTELILSLSERIKGIIKGLPSGYNRDFQDTKEPLMEGFNATVELINIITLMCDRLTVNKDNLIKACTPELYATDKVMQRVKDGGNFRDSYKDVGLNLDKVEMDDPVSALSKRTVQGSAGNLNEEEAKGKLSLLRRSVEERKEDLRKIYLSLNKNIEQVIL